MITSTNLGRDDLGLERGELAEGHGNSAGRVHDVQAHQITQLAPLRLAQPHRDTDELIALAKLADRQAGQPGADRRRDILVCQAAERGAVGIDL